MSVQIQKYNIQIKHVNNFLETGHPSIMEKRRSDGTACFPSWRNSLSDEHGLKTWLLPFLCKSNVVRFELECLFKGINLDDFFLFKRI